MHIKYFVKKKLKILKFSSKCINQNRILPISKKYTHYTGSLPKKTSDGSYSDQDIKEMFQDKNLSEFEIRKVFEVMDLNNG